MSPPRNPVITSSRYSCGRSDADQEERGRRAGQISAQQVRGQGAHRQDGDQGIQGQVQAIAQAGAKTGSQEHAQIGRRVS